MFQSAGVSFQTSRDTYTQGKHREGGSEEGQAEFQRRLEKKKTVFDGSTLGQGRRSLWGHSPKTGDRGPHGKHTLGECLLFWEVNAQWVVPGGPEGPQLHVARESFIVTDFLRHHQTHNKSALRRGRKSCLQLSQVSAGNFFAPCPRHYFGDSQDCFSQPSSEYIFGWNSALNSAFPDRIPVGSSVSPLFHWPIPPLVFLDSLPRAVHLGVFPPWQAISTFSLCPGWPWLPITLISAQYHIRSGHVFLPWPRPSYSWCTQLFPSRPSGSSPALGTRQDSSCVDFWAQQRKALDTNNQICMWSRPLNTTHTSNNNLCVYCWVCYIQDICVRPLMKASSDIFTDTFETPHLYHRNVTPNWAHGPFNSGSGHNSQHLLCSPSILFSTSQAFSYSIWRFP